MPKLLLLSLVNDVLPRLVDVRGVAMGVNYGTGPVRFPAALPVGGAFLGRLVGEALHVLDRTRDLGVQHLHVHFATESAIVAHLVHQLGGPTYSITAHA